MDNLHKAIWEYFDDFHQPSAKGAVYPIPFLWNEEAHADAAVYEEQKRLNYMMKPYFVPKWLYREKEEQPEPKEEFAVDEKALAKILMEYDERLIIRMKARRYNIKGTNAVVYALVDLADANDWVMTAGYGYKQVYRIR